MTIAPRVKLEAKSTNVHSFYNSSLTTATYIYLRTTATNCNPPKCVERRGLIIIVPLFFALLYILRYSLYTLFPL